MTAALVRVRAASLVFRWAMEVDIEAEFTWSDKKRTFRSRWKYRAPEPTIKGAFSAP